MNNSNHGHQQHQQQRHESQVLSRLQPVAALLRLMVLPFVTFWALWAPNPEDRVVFVGDILVGAYPTRVYVHQLLTSGQSPWWNPYQLGGMPLLGDIQVAVYYVPNLILDLIYWNTDIPYTGFEALVVAHYALAGVFMFAYLRSLRLSRTASLVGAIAFQFNGFLIGHRGHYSMFSVVVWVPAVMWAFDQMRLATNWTKTFLWIFAGSLFLSQMIMGGHPQLTFYSGLFIISYVLFQSGGQWSNWLAYWASDWRRFIQHSAVKTVLGFGVVGVLAIGLSTITWLPMIELLGRSLRSEPTYAFTVQFPLMPRNLITLFLPEFLNWSGTEFRIYAGIFTLLLAVISWVLSDGKMRELRFFTAVLVIATILSFGGFTSLHSFLYRFVPGFSSVRVTARIFYFANISLAVLAAIGIEYLLHELSQRSQANLDRFVRANRWPLGLLALFLLVGYGFLILNYRSVGDDFYFYESVFVPILGVEADADRYRFITQIVNTVWILVVFWGVSLLLVLLKTNGHLSRALFGFAAVSLMAVDMTTFATQHDVQRAPDFESIGMDGFDIYTMEWWQRNEREQLIAELSDLPAYSRIDNSLEVLPPNYSQVWRLNFSSGYNILDLQERFEVFTQWPYLNPSTAWDLMNVSHIVTEPADANPPEDAATILVENSQGIIWERANLPQYAHFSTQIRPVYDSVTVNGMLWYADQSAFTHPALALDDDDVQLTTQLEISWPELVDPTLYQIGDTGVASPVDMMIIAGRSNQYSAIVIAGQTVTPQERGMIYALIEPDSGEIVTTGSFDTFLSTRNSDQLARIIQAAPEGTIVALATFDEGTSSSTAALQKAFQSVGSRIDLSEKSGQAIAVIGVKGAPIGSALEATGEELVTLDVGMGAFVPPESVTFQSDIVQYTPNEIVLLVENDQTGLLTISESVYPGWRATINGEEVPILRSNGLFRSIILPPNDSNTPHEVVFTYMPISAALGMRLSLGTLIGLIIAVMGHLLWFYRLRFIRRAEPAPQELVLETKTQASQ